MKMKTYDNSPFCPRRKDCIHGDECLWDYIYRADFRCFERPRYENVVRKPTLKFKARRKDNEAISK